MARTGPQKYPGASTAHWYGNKYPGSAMETNVIVWHSTEGFSLPTYGGGASAPTFTAVPDFDAKRLRWYQHFDFDASARALVNRSGGVETNTLNVAQVEVVGTCDSRHAKTWSGRKAGTGYLYMGDLPEWVIRDLGAFCKWAHDKHGVPLSSGVTFKAYPNSYGSNGVRMSGAKWSSFRGHCGHQHVPENDHGDPGAFPMAAILTAAKGGNTAPDLMEEVESMSRQQVKDAVWETDDLQAPPSASTAKTNKTWKASAYLKEIYERLLEIKAEQREQASRLTAIEKKVK